MKPLLGFRVNLYQVLREHINEKIKERIQQTGYPSKKDRNQEITMEINLLESHCLLDFPGTKLICESLLKAFKE